MSKQLIIHCRKKLRRQERNALSLSPTLIIAIICTIENRPCLAPTISLASFVLFLGIFLLCFSIVSIIFYNLRKHPAVFCGQRGV